MDAFGGLPYLPQISVQVPTKKIAPAACATLHFNWEVWLSGAFLMAWIPFRIRDRDQEVVI